MDREQHGDHKWVTHPVPVIFHFLLATVSKLFVRVRSFAMKQWPKENFTITIILNWIMLVDRQFQNLLWGLQTAKTSPTVHWKLISYQKCHITTELQMKICLWASFLKTKLSSRKIFLSRMSTVTLSQGTLSCNCCEDTYSDWKLARRCFVDVLNLTTLNKPVDLLRETCVWRSGSTDNRRSILSVFCISLTTIAA